MLASGGHNAGVVSEPGHPNRHYALLSRTADEPMLDPVHWAASAPRHDGSWWPAWQDGLLGHGSAHTVKARTPAAADVLGHAPGEFEHVRYRD